MEASQPPRDDLRFEKLEQNINRIKSDIRSIHERLDKTSNFIAHHSGQLEKITEGKYLTPKHKTHLIKLLNRSFDKTEFYDLCLDMDVNPELFNPDDSLRSYNLISYFDRRSSIGELITRLIQLRPMDNWKMESI